MASRRREWVVTCVDDDDLGISSLRLEEGAPTRHQRKNPPRGPTLFEESGRAGGLRYPDESGLMRQIKSYTMWLVMGPEWRAQRIVTTERVYRGARVVKRQSTSRMGALAGHP